MGTGSCESIHRGAMKCIASTVQSTDRKSKRPFSTPRRRRVRVPVTRCWAPRRRLWAALHAGPDATFIFSPVRPGGWDGGDARQEATVSGARMHDGAPWQDDAAMLNSLLDFVSSSLFLGAMAQGLCYAAVGCGVYITFRTLAVPDLTIDSKVTGDFREITRHPHIA
jgi:hypothetical protein